MQLLPRPSRRALCVLMHALTTRLNHTYITAPRRGGWALRTPAANRSVVITSAYTRGAISKSGAPWRTRVRNVMATRLLCDAA